jgi:predicted small metal-binding protein
MAFSLACSDSGASCPASFTTESKDELMEHVMMHAQKAHPEMKMDEAAKKQVEGLVKTV